MVMPHNFRNIGDDNLTSYSYEEILSGVGYVRFFLGKASGSYYTNIIAFNSSPESTDGSWSGGGSTTVHDIDFDMVLNSNMNIVGDWLCSVPLTYLESNSNASRTVTVTCYLRQWDGSTETELGSGVTDSASMDHDTARIFTTIETISAVTIPKGDTLRISVKVEVSGGAGDVGNLDIFHEPRGAVTEAEITASNMVSSIASTWIPTRIVR